MVMISLIQMLEQRKMKKEWIPSARSGSPPMICEAGSFEAEGVPEVSGAAADLLGCGAPLEGEAGEGHGPSR
eukprot:18932-Pyramimonas_sp.AAC.1